jgi:hypothetical protein
MNSRNTTKKKGKERNLKEQKNQKVNKVLLVFLISKEKQRYNYKIISSINVYSMYTLLNDKQWENGKRYSIFGVPDIGDFSVAFGTWNPYDVAIKNVKQANDIKKAKSIARVEGMKEGALSAPIVYFERDVRSTEGNFMPKVQTKNITKVFNEVNVKKETKNQTINALSDRLKTVNKEYKSVMTTPMKSKSANPEVVPLPAKLKFENIDVEKTKQLLKEKEFNYHKINKPQ